MRADERWRGGMWLPRKAKTAGELCIEGDVWGRVGGDVSVCVTQASANHVSGLPLSRARGLKLGIGVPRSVQIRSAKLQCAVPIRSTRLSTCRDGGAHGR